MMCCLSYALSLHFASAQPSPAASQPADISLSAPPVMHPENAACMKRTPRKVFCGNICFCVGLLLLLGLDVSVAQQLPPGPSPLPTLRRGADGLIEVIPTETVPPAEQLSPTAPTTASKPPQQAPTAPQQASTVPSRPPTALRRFVANIHNAHGWATNHAYRVGDRVNAGPGYRPTGTPGGGTYTSGSAVYGWQATSGGTSASRGNGPAISGSCTASTAVNDNGILWKCLSATDYLTIHAWLADAALWAPGVTINAYERRRSGEMIYAESLPNCSTTNPNACSCVTGTVAPAGVTYPIKDGTCTWRSVFTSTYQNSDPSPGYSSELGLAIPTKVSSPVACAGGTYCGVGGGQGNPMTVMMNGQYMAVVWNDRPINNSTDVLPIKFFDHTGQCDGGGEDPTYLPSCVAANQIGITAAPGECFCDSRSNPLAFNPANGVSIEDSSGLDGYGGPFIIASDEVASVSRLQMKSDNNIPLRSVGGSNAMQLLLDGKVGALSMDGGTSCINTVAISHGAYIVSASYANFFDHCTLVGTPGTTVVGIAAYVVCGIGCPNLIYNTAIFGAQYAFACSQYTNGPPAGSIAGCVSTDPNSLSAGNMTDAPNTSGVIVVAAGGSYSTQAIPGTTYGASLVNSFVHPATDFRLKAGSPLIGVGVAPPPTSVWTFSAVSGVPLPLGATDITGLARPQNGKYDVGAYQSSAN